MTVSDLDLVTPDPGTASAGALSTVATVFAVDSGARLVQVGIQGEALRLPAQPGRYRAGGLARVLLHPTTRRPEAVLGPLDPTAPAVLATVTAISGTTVTVTWAGSPLALPAAPSTYTVGQTAWVLTDDWGAPVLVLAPSALAPPDQPTTPTPPSGGGTVQVTQQIGPQWSGSWRSSRGAWDRWNTDRYGGRTTLYQGNAYGSGPMVGLAVYGRQLADLGATSIDRISVRVRSLGIPGSSGPAVLVGTTDFGPAPGGGAHGTGATATGEGSVDLPATVREAFRTGAIGGLATVGSPYCAFAGAGNGDGMVLDVTYTRPA